MSCQLSWSTFLAIFFALSILIHRLFLIIYNVYIHPLSRFPGLISSAASRIPFSRATFKGNLIHYIDSIHQTYGPIVRIAPDELTIIEAKAWTDLYAHRPQLPKAPATLIQPLSGIHSLFSADDANHQRMRRVLGHAFSERALKEQEPIIQSHTDAMMQKLQAQCTVMLASSSSTASASIDAAKTYYHVTLDTLSDLTFGESFNCIENDGEHPWVANLFRGIKGAFILTCLRNYPPLGTIITKLLMTASAKQRAANERYIFDKVQQCLSRADERPDFMSHMIRHLDAGKGGITRDELQANAVGFILTGGDSPGATMSAATLLLLQNPETMKSLKNEIRQSFHAQEDIVMSAIPRLPYLRAVLDEALRLGHPAPTHSPRIIPPGGQMVAGHWIPGGTSIGVPHYAASHSTHNFDDVEPFRPERWLLPDQVKSGKVSNVAKNDLAIVQPFSAGPRSCLGKNLAYAIMSIILAKMVWNFDMELGDAEHDKEWLRRKVYLVFEAKPLPVILRPRKMEVM